MSLLVLIAVVVHISQMIQNLSPASKTYAVRLFADGTNYCVIRFELKKNRKIRNIIVCNKWIKQQNDSFDQNLREAKGRNGTNARTFLPFPLLPHTWYKRRQLLAHVSSDRFHLKQKEVILFKNFNEKNQMTISLQKYQNQITITLQKRMMIWGTITTSSVTAWRTRCHAAEKKIQNHH